MKRSYIKHSVLFILTIGTTFLMGYSDGPVGAAMYSGGLMGILLFHEMGHYLMARKYHVPATLPFFIPMPLPPFGTMGAVIKMRGNIPNRRALFDIGAAGPLAGLALIIPVIVVGIRLSRIVQIDPTSEGYITLGDSLLFSFIAKLSVGAIPEGHDLVLHPLAYAGWVGLFVTALNLLPVGQLDGGHVVYALFYKKSRWVSAGIYAVLVSIFLFYFAGWFLIVILLAIFHRHPPTLNDAIPPDPKRKILGGFALLIFVVSFTPVPFGGIAEGLVPMILKANGWMP